MLSKDRNNFAFYLAKMKPNQFEKQHFTVIEQLTLREKISEYKRLAIGWVSKVVHKGSFVCKNTY